MLLVSLALLRGLQYWLVNSYLPTTSMDAGAQNSVTMVVRYAGIIAAVLWSLAALGIGMEKLAVVLGARRSAPASACRRSRQTLYQV